METCGVEDHAQFAQQFLENRAAVGETGKLDAIAIDVEDRGLFPRDDNFSKVAQRCGGAAKELNQRVRILKRTRIDDH